MESLLHNPLANINSICTENKIGLPSAITTLDNKYLIVGTTLCSVIVFDVGENEPVIVKPEKTGYGAIVTIDISKDEIFIACGCESGFIFFINKSSSSISKVIPPEVLNVSISRLMFIGDSYGSLLRSDVEGNIFVYSVEKFIWQTVVESKRLLPAAKNVVYYNIKTRVINRKKIVCLSCFDYVLCLMFFDNSEPEVVCKINRKEKTKEFTIKEDSIPNIELGCFNVGG